MLAASDKQLELVAPCHLELNTVHRQNGIHEPSWLGWNWHFKFYFGRRQQNFAVRCFDSHGNAVFPRPKITHQQEAHPLNRSRDIWEDQVYVWCNSVKSQER